MKKIKTKQTHESPDNIRMVCSDCLTELYPPISPETLAAIVPGDNVKITVSTDIVNPSWTHKKVMAAIEAGKCPKNLKTVSTIVPAPFHSSDKTISEETFWVRVMEHNDNKLVGMINNELVNTDIHGCKLNDIVEFEDDNVRCVGTKNKL